MITTIQRLRAEIEFLAFTNPIRAQRLAQILTLLEVSVDLARRAEALHIEDARMQYLERQRAVPA